MSDEDRTSPIARRREAVVAYFLCGLDRSVVAALVRLTETEVNDILAKYGSVDDVGRYVISEAVRTELRLPCYVPRQRKSGGTMTVNTTYLNRLHAQTETNV